MATQTSMNTVGHREDLSELVSLVEPHKTPFISNIGQKKVTNLKHEWQIDALNPPNPNNANLEGTPNMTNDAVAPRQRVGNIIQLMDKVGEVTNTQEALKVAGIKSELAHVIMKTALELKTDYEVNLLSGTASTYETGAQPRRFGGVRSWLETNVSFGAGGVAGGYDDASGLTQAPIAGTARPFTEALLQNVVSQLFHSGASAGDTLHAYMSLSNKQAFGTFPGLSQTRDSVKGGDERTVYGAADIYISDIGKIMVIPHQYAFNTNNDVLLLNHKYWEKAVLRPVRQKKKADTQDSQKFQLVQEVGLCSKNEKASAMIADLI